MSNFVHSLDSVVYRLQPLLIGIAIMAWIAAAIVTLRHIRRQPLVVAGPRPMAPAPYFVAAFLVFGGIICLEALLHAIINSAALAEVRPVLDSPVSAVRVNGRSVTEPAPLISALRDISQPIMGHHSHPTRRLEVQIEGDGYRLMLYVARDSGNPREYWVYYPGFRATMIADIGHVFTPALDEF
jgi:hypothetical protein